MKANHVPRKEKKTDRCQKGAGLTGRKESRWTKGFKGGKKGQAILAIASGSGNEGAGHVLLERKKPMGDKTPAPVLGTQEKEDRPHRIHWERRDMASFKKEKRDAKLGGSATLFHSKGEKSGVGGVLPDQTPYISCEELSTFKT